MHWAGSLCGSAARSAENAKSTYAKINPLPRLESRSEINLVLGWDRPGLPASAVPPRRKEAGASSFFTHSLVSGFILHLISFDLGGGGGGSRVPDAYAIVAPTNTDPKNDTAMDQITFRTIYSFFLLLLARLSKFIHTFIPQPSHWWIKKIMELIWI